MAERETAHEKHDNATKAADATGSHDEHSSGTGGRARRDSSEDSHKPPYSERRRDVLGAGLEESMELKPAIMNLLDQISGQIRQHKNDSHEMDALAVEISERSREFTDKIAANTLSDHPSN